MYGLAEGVRCGEAEGQVVGIDVVGVAVDQGDLQVDERIAGAAPGLRLLAQAGLDRRDELGGDHAALELVDEVEHRHPLGWVSGSRSIVTFAYRPGAAGLADATPLDVLDRLLDRLAVADARPADVDLQPVVADHPVLEDLHVQLAHARDERLPGLLVDPVGEGRVLARQGR